MPSKYIFQHVLHYDFRQNNGTNEIAIQTQPLNEFLIYTTFKNIKNVLYCSLYSNRLLPVDAVIILNKFFGGTDIMSTFRGSKKQD